MIFRLVSCVFMSPAPTTIGLAARLRHSPRTASNPPGLPTTRRRNGRVCYETLRYQAFRDRSVVAIVVIADPDSPPAPRCRPPTPTRATIETNAGDEWHRREGEAAMMEPIEARRKSLPEREAARPGE